MHAFARRLLQRGVLGALNRWNVLAQERRDERRRLHSLARRAFSPLSKGWRMWLEHSERRRQLRALLGRGLSGSCAKAFHSWYGAVEERRRAQRLAARVLSGGGLLHKTWNHWVAGVRVCACVCVRVLARSCWPPPPLFAAAAVCHHCLPPLLATASCHRCDCACHRCDCA